MKCKYYPIKKYNKKNMIKIIKTIYRFNKYNL